MTPKEYYWEFSKKKGYYWDENLKEKKSQATKQRLEKIGSQTPKTHQEGQRERG